jgi:L-alanine-DL-glutamate epimerase-like enolase superfamily enzyme
VPSAAAAAAAETVRERVPAYASTLFRETPEQMAAAARMYVDAGFKAVKFGWGGVGRDRARDVAGVRAARAALGPDRQLLIDAGWILPRSTKDTFAMVDAVAPFDPYWVEEPCHPEDYAGYGAIAAGSRVRIAAGEQEATLWGFERLLREGKVDVVQPDLSRCGGFTVARKVIALAQLAGCSICPHAWMSDLMTASALHYNAVLPNFSRNSTSATTRSPVRCASSRSAWSTASSPCRRAPASASAWSSTSTSSTATASECNKV